MNTRTEPAWTVGSLAELIKAKVISAVSGYSSGEHNQDGIGVAHIRPYNVTTEGSISLVQIKSVPVSRHSKELSLLPNDVLFNNTNSEELVGKTALWKSAGTFGFSNHMTRIRVHDDERLVSQYLAFYLHHHWESGASRMFCRRHVAQASIIGERFSSIPVTLPGVKEQRKIAAVLGKVQAAVELEGDLIRVMRELKQAALRQFFSWGVRGERQKQTELGPVPESWEITRVDNLGKVLTGTTPKTANRAFYENGKIDFISPGDISEDGTEIRSVAKKVTAAGLATARELPRGSTCFVCIGSTIGKVGITIQDRSAFNQQINAVIPSSDFSPLYVFYTLLWNAGHIANRASPSPVPIMSKSLFSEALVCISRDRTEQQEIASHLATIDAKIAHHEARQKLLRELFRTLLGDLMTGRRRVTELPSNE